MHIIPMLAGVKEWCSWCWCLVSEAPLAVVHLLSWKLSEVKLGWVRLSGRDVTRGIDTDGYTWHWHYGGRLFFLIWIWTDCYGLISYFGTCWNLVELQTIRRSRFNPLNKDLGTYASCQKEDGCDTCYAILTLSPRLPRPFERLLTKIAIDRILHILLLILVQQRIGGSLSTATAKPTKSHKFPTIESND